MKRRSLREYLIVALLFSAGFAAWTWFRPYAFNVDPAARCTVVGCQVRRDQSYFWVDAHLKMVNGKTHDLLKPVRLITGAGHAVEPADTTLGGTDGLGTSDLWFKFWLESDHMKGPLELQINDGTLVIKANSGLPALSASNIEYFVTNRW